MRVRDHHLEIDCIYSPLKLFHRSSGKMPQAVREALIEVFQTHGVIEREDAEKQLLSMEKEGRYKQETW